MARFMSDGIYNTWLSQEENNYRIEALKDRDPNRPAEDAANRADVHRSDSQGSIKEHVCRNHQTFHFTGMGVQQAKRGIQYPDKGKTLPQHHRPTIRS